MLLNDATILKKLQPQRTYPSLYFSIVINGTNQKIEYLNEVVE